jgi:NADH-quinone oxidoreductase subunit M
MRLSLIAIIYSSLVAFSQKDMKKLIAYSSIAHMGYVTAAIFTLTSTGIEAAIYQMISHGLISSGLFFAVGMMYDKMHTKEISAYGGMAQRAPILATFFLLLVFASIGLPGSSGFIGELLSLISIFEYNKLYASLAAAGVVLSAIYMLNLYRKVAFGTVSNKVEKISDIKTKEAVILFPIILFVIVLGIRPNLILNNLFFQSIKLSEKLHK